MNNKTDEQLFEQNKFYLDKNVHIYLKPMIKEILSSKPHDVLDFIITWCQNKKREQIPQQNKYDLSDNEASEEEKEDPARMQKLERLKQKGKKKMAISAEAYGQYNKIEDYVPVIVIKSPEEKEYIRSRLINNFMFNTLDPKDFNIIINAMAIKTYQPNEYIIKQGDDGNELFIVAEGKQKCYKLFPGKSEDTFLKDYGPGDLFGELALMYNTPRAASIIATTQSKLFSLDRQTFNAIVKTSAIKKREKFEDFLNKVDILKSLDAYERSKICDCLQTEKYKKNEVIIKEGDEGNKFYFIQEGTGIAIKKWSNGKDIKVFDYQPNDYFGELALLNNCKRKASIVVTSDEMVVACLDKLSFQRLLGPIEQLLKRNADMYAKYVTNVNS